MFFMRCLLISWLSGWYSHFAKSFPVKPVSRGLITDDHLKIANLCKDVYRKEVETLDTFVESKDTGVQATVSLDERRAIVCLRGSDARVDWKNNFNMGKVPFLSRKHRDPVKQVHAGFFIGHTSVKGKIYRKLNDIVDSGECDRILFCGHSAGVVSTLLAYDYLNKRDLPIEIVTFGAPRLCNKKFADDFNKNMHATRIINDFDLIPLAPLKILGFHHVGNDLIHIKNSKVSNQDHSIVEEVGRRVMGLFRLDAGVRDHRMESYVEEIEKCLDKNE